MSKDDSLPNSLKEAAERFKGETKNSKVAAVARAFELFSQETERLEGAYESLKEEFLSIHKELERTNNELKCKVDELGALTFYLKSILTNISQGILFIDLNGDITTCNPAAEEILKVEGAELLSRPFWRKLDDEIFGYSMREALASKKVPSTSKATFKDALQPDKSIEISSTFVSKESGSCYHCDEVNKVEGIIVVLRDVTHLRSLELIALRNDRMKELGEMAALVAHEIRNPIGGIKGFATLLKRDLKEGSKELEMVSHIIKGTEQLGNLVTNVLNYSRPNPLHFETCDVVKLANKLKELFDAEREHKNSAVELVIDTKLKSLSLYIDPKAFNRALLNLIYNARDAMSEGGKIIFSIATCKKLAIIAVADSGTGIAKENIDKIFTPLFTTKREGNGFGLAEVQKTILAHRGVVEVETEVGKGTTFTITLPLIEDRVNDRKKR